MKPGKIAFDHKATLRFLLFGIFLTGNVVFMSYKASLTSKLAVRERVLPFQNLEDFLASDYR